MNILVLVFLLPRLESDMVRLVDGGQTALHHQPQVAQGYNANTLKGKAIQQLLSRGKCNGHVGASARGDVSLEGVDLPAVFGIGICEPLLLPMAMVAVTLACSLDTKDTTWGFWALPIGSITSPKMESASRRRASLVWES